MSNMNNILNKIAKAEKVELAKHEVNLAVLDNIKSYTAGYDKFYSELQGLQKRGDRLKSELNDTISAIYKMGEVGRSMANDMANLLGDFADKAKELGLDAKSNKDYIDGQKAFKAYVESEKAAQRVAENLIKVR